MTHTQSTAALTAVQRAQNVVLEQTRHAVVGEPLAQFDNGHQPGGEGQILRDVAQDALLVIVGFLAVGSDGEVFLVKIHVGFLVHHDLLHGSLIVALRPGMSQ